MDAQRALKWVENQLIDIRLFLLYTTLATFIFSCSTIQLLKMRGKSRGWEKNTRGSCAERLRTRWSFPSNQHKLHQSNRQLPQQHTTFFLNLAHPNYGLIIKPDSYHFWKVILLHREETSRVSYQSNLCIIQITLQPFCFTRCSKNQRCTFSQGKGDI